METILNEIVKSLNVGTLFVCLQVLMGYVLFDTTKRVNKIHLKNHEFSDFLQKLDGKLTSHIDNLNLKLEMNVKSVNETILSLRELNKTIQETTAKLMVLESRIHT